MTWEEQNQPDRRSEYGGAGRTGGTDRASDRLRNLYRSGNEDSTTPDDGSTFVGLTPRRRRDD